MQVGLLDDHEERLLGLPAGLHRRWEVAPVADARDREIDRPEPGVPASVPIGVAARQAALGCPFATSPRASARFLLPDSRAREDDV